MQNDVIHGGHNIVDNYFYDQKSPKINHLNKEQIDELIRRYYANEKVVSLIKDFNIGTKANNISSLFPRKVYKALLCEHCGNYMSAHFRTKISRTRETEPVCISCNHNNTKYCSCEKCFKIKEEEKINEIKIREEIIVKYYSQNPNDAFIEKSQLNYMDKLYLGAVLRAGIDEELLLIKGDLLFDNKLAPNANYAKEILNYLSEERKLIRVSEKSPYTAFVSCNEFPRKFKVYKVYYDLQIKFSDDEEKRSFISELITGNFDKAEMLQNSLELWNKIGLEECKEYLSYRIESVGWQFSPGSKTNIVFDKLLQDYSISQVFGIIFSAVKNSVFYYNSKSISKTQAVNSVISNCQKIGEYSLAQGYTRFKPYRDNNCAQSIISMFLFDNIFGIGDKGFYNVPTNIKDIII